MIFDFLDEKIEDLILYPMEKILWKKELYFVRYSISNFREFSRIFLKLFRYFSDFKHIYKTTTPNF